MSSADSGLPARLPLLAARARIVAALRGYFHDDGFLEVETPARVVCPGLEPHLVAFPAPPDRWLITSPELHLKRLVAAGAEKVFEIARCFRNDEAGPWHLSEFTMLEWYRTRQGLDTLIEDVRQLLRRGAQAAGVDPSGIPGCDLSLPLERLTVREAFSRYANLDLAAHRESAALGRALDRLGLARDAGDDWDDLFFRLYLEKIEPRLGHGRVTILEEFPASQAALARVRNDPEWPVALRFEVFASGIELANAFDELTDPAEQRRRHEADRARRRQLGRETPPLDEPFLAALETGMPPTVGIALGVDRLAGVILGQPARNLVPFPEEI